MLIAGNARLDVEEVPRARAAEAVDRLRVVAHDREARVGAAQRAQHVDLERVHVLVLVDAHVVDLGRELRAEPVVGSGRAPVEEQVVEVDEAEHALAVHVRAADRRDRLELIARTTARLRR